MKKLVTLGLVLLFSASASAQWGKKVKGNGNMTTIERSVGDYDRIGVSGFFDVDLVSGSEGEISLKGGIESIGSYCHRSEKRPTVY